MKGEGREIEGEEREDRRERETDGYRGRKKGER